MFGVLGISLYQCVFGKFPFEGNTMYEINSRIRTKKLDFPREISSELSDLLQRMLIIKPAERISISEILKHSFFRNTTPNPSFELEPKLIPELDPTLEILYLHAKFLTDDDVKTQISISSSWSGFQQSRIH